MVANKRTILQVKLFFYQQNHAIVAHRMRVVESTGSNLEDPTLINTLIVMGVGAISSWRTWIARFLMHAMIG